MTTWTTPTASLVLDDVVLTRTLHPRYRDLPALRTAVEVGGVVLRDPLVAGVAPLVRAEGRVHAWRCGATAPLATLRWRAAGLRAASELAWLAGSVLADAVEVAASQGIHAHGDLSPWSLGLLPTGALQVVGFGLPEPEAARMRLTHDDTGCVEALQHTPPERFTEVASHTSGDLYALALLVVDVALPPAPPRSLDVLRRGACRSLLDHALTHHLPPPVADVLHAALHPHPAGRPTVAAWIDAWQHVLAAPPPGPRLADLVAAPPVPRR